MLLFPNKNQNINFESFAQNYFNTLKKIYEKINVKKIERIADELTKIIKKRGNIYIAGNGGSAAIANHFICDFNKSILISTKNQLKPRFFSLSSSPEMLTAIANDLSKIEVFSKQLEMLAQKGDALIVISCSGNSKNINNAIKFAKKVKIKIIYFCGFNEKNIHKLKYFINLDCKNYGATEDVFSSLFHIISQFIRFKYSKKKEIL